MPINVGKKGKSPHGEAAAELTGEAMTSEVMTTTTPQDGEPQENHELSVEAVQVPPQFERIDVGMAFKMPIAQYTMLEFSVKRSVPYDPEVTSPDDVFDQTRLWVEEKINHLIEEQQQEEALGS